MRHACHRLTIKQLTFVPYGDTVDGSTERLVYRKQLMSYLRDSLLPVLASWEGEMPKHLQKVSNNVFTNTLAPLRLESRSEADQVPEISCLSCHGQWQSSLMDACRETTQWNRSAFSSSLGPLPSCHSHDMHGCRRNPYLDVSCFTLGLVICRSAERTRLCRDWCRCSTC